jgi:hypothetical protein
MPFAYRSAAFSPASIKLQVQQVWQRQLMQHHARHVTLDTAADRLADWVACSASNAACRWLRSKHQCIACCACICHRCCAQGLLFQLRSACTL